MIDIIEVKNLVKTYKDLKAVDDLSFKVKKGEIFGLLGPNGSGKSTTINIILSLLSFDSGQIRVLGDEMSPNSYEIKSKIGVVFQEIGVFDELSVYENIDYFCGLYVIDKKKRKDLVDEAIDFVGLNEFRNFKPKKLSGGLLRRLNIACGISHKPKLIFLDEPTVAVDPQSRNKILEGIKKLNYNGATIFYTSHYMEEVEEICDHIAVIDKGKLIAEGNTSTLKEMIQMNERIILRSEEMTLDALNDINKLENVLDVSSKGNEYSIIFSKGSDNIINIASLLKKRNLSYSTLTSLTPTLNDVFLELTGKELRD